MRIKIIILVVTLFLLSGCDNQSDNQTTVSAAGVGNPIGPGDMFLLEIAEKLPDFGGMFYDAEGNLNIYTVDSSPNLASKTLEERTKEYERILSPMIGKKVLSHTGPRDRTGKKKNTTKPPLKIVKGQYRITQLLEWRLNTDSLLELEGMVFTDLDERNNRVKIGVESKKLSDKIGSFLEKLKIPKQAVIIEVVQPIVFFDSLKSKFRPPTGGIQLEIDTGWFDYANCTLGFNAHRSGIRGFVTNSHCTNKRGAVDGSDFHQPSDPLFSEGNKIGDEIADPPYFTNGICPSGRECRYSDSAFVKYQVDRGKGIAKTDSWSNGSLTISSTPPKELKIVGKNSYPIFGSELDKIGRTTGWSIGNVNGSCLNINSYGTNVTLLCQTRVNRIFGQSQPIVGPGDSGSPVFRWEGDSVVLAGILWGGRTDGSTFVYSPINQIEQELGDLITYNFPSPPPITGCSVNNCCNWEIPSFPSSSNKPICTRCSTTFSTCYQANEDNLLFTDN